MASEMLTPSPRWLRTAAVLFLLAMLQACATMSASECRTASWRDVGLRDGLAGEPLGLLDRRTRACAEAGVAVNVPLYLEGRNQGLPDYCRLDNAARQGLAGKTYHGVCAPGKFATSFCLQVGTKSQYTRCSSVADGGKTCINPEIKYGNVPGGVPAQHPGTDFPKWCQQLGFAGWSGQVSYGNRPCLSPKGKLFGWTGYDEPGWHWCDWQDGVWYNQALNYQQCNDGAEITSITCQ